MKTPLSFVARVLIAFVAIALVAGFVVLMTFDSDHNTDTFGKSASDIVVVPDDPASTKAP